MNKNTYFRSKIITIIIFLICFILIKFTYKQFISKKSKIKIEQAFNKENIIPVAILGSGPAGQAAGIYASRLGFKTVIFEGSKPGGQLTETSYVENWPGEKKILGNDLMKKLKEHNLGFNVSFVNENITKVNFETWPFELWTSEKIKLNALSVIIATGSSPRRLNVTGENEYWGKGVTTCAICDAPFYKGKDVIVVGGGDSACEQVLQLSPHVKQINMLVRKEQLRASRAMQDRIGQVKNLTIFYNSELKKIIGDGNHVVSVDILNNETGLIKNKQIDGVFLAIGHIPNTTLFKGQLKMDSSDYIKVHGRSQKTSVDGVFAAGDVEDHVYMQAGIASGAGIKAALDASNFLHSIGFTNEISKKLENRYFEFTNIGSSQVLTINTINELDKIIASTNLPIILDFWAKHCPTCIHMLPSFEDLSKKYSGKMIFVKINSDESPELVKKLFVVKVPTFIVMKKNEIIARFHDFMDKQQMNDFIGKFI